MPFKPDIDPKTGKLQEPVRCAENLSFWRPMDLRKQQNGVYLFYSNPAVNRHFGQVDKSPKSVMRPICDRSGSPGCAALCIGLNYTATPGPLLYLAIWAWWERALVAGRWSDSLANELGVPHTEKSEGGVMS